MAQPGDVVITTRELYDEVRAVHDEVKGVRNEVKNAVGPTLMDHESRLRALERKVWAAAGAAAVLGGGVVQGLHSILGG